MTETPEDPVNAGSEVNYRLEAFWALGYFALYFVYLFINPESETEHWATMVAIPFVGLFLYQRLYTGSLSIRRTLTSLGLRGGNLTTWIGWALLLGFGLTVLNLFIGNRTQGVLDLFESGKGFWMYPLVLVLLLLTAGFTEEVMFRGLLQTRLTNWLGSKFWSIAIVSVLFAIYHIPYAYLNPNWPSAGNLLAATGAAFANGLPGGIILGLVYERAKHNLLASVIVHTLINSLPAMTMIKFGTGG